MTKDSFCRTVRAVLTDIPGISWNSVTESILASLGRRFEAGAITVDEVVDEMKHLFPLASIRRDVESQLHKALRS